MISGTVVQTLILVIITMRLDWEKEVIYSSNGDPVKDSPFGTFCVIELFCEQAQRAQIQIAKEATSKPRISAQQ